jgi:hypothetical protein
METNKTLTTLIVSDCTIDSRGAEAIARVLGKNTTLKKFLK